MSELSLIEARDLARQFHAELEQDYLPHRFVVKPNATRVVRRGAEWIGITSVEYVLGTVRVDGPRSGS